MSDAVAEILIDAQPMERADASADRPTRSHEAEFDRRYAAGGAQWANARPSTELARRLAELKLEPGTAIELGCGSGTNSIFLATQGFATIGIDSSAAAIDIARETAAEAGVEVEFAVRDVCNLDGSLGTFDLVFDRGCYHFVRLFGLDGYLKSLHDLTRPGSTVILLAGNANQDAKGPPRVTAADLTAELSLFFDLKEMREFQFDDRGWIGWSAVLERRASARLTGSSRRSASRAASASGEAAVEGSETDAATARLQTRLSRVLAELSWAPSCPWSIELGVTATTPESADLRIAYRAKDGAGEPVVHERKGAFGAEMARQEVLDVVTANLAAIAVREVLESVVVAGRPLFGPEDARRLADLKYADGLAGAR